MDVYSITEELSFDPLSSKGVKCLVVPKLTLQTKPITEYSVSNYSSNVYARWYYANFIIKSWLFFFIFYSKDDFFFFFQIQITWNVQIE